MNMIFCDWINDRVGLSRRLSERYSSRKSYILTGLVIFEPLNSSEIEFDHTSEDECLKQLAASELLPLENDFIKALSCYENIVMKMADRRESGRLNVESNSQEYAERVRRYHFYLRFWYSFIKCREIRIAVFSLVPHCLPSFMLYAVSKALGVHTAFPFQTHVTGYSLFYASLDKIVPDMERKYTRLTEELKDTPHESIILHPKEVADSYDFYSNKSNDKTPYFMHIDISAARAKYNNKKYIAKVQPPKTLRQLIAASLKKRYGDDSILIALGARFEKVALMIKNKFRRLSKPRLLKKYIKLAVKPDYGKRYIYLALHHQPEATTSPMAGVFVNQLLLAQMLSYHVPDDVILYVKEHPFQDSKNMLHFREAHMYDDIAALPNAYLVQLETDTYKLIENSIAVASCTGTAGFEALFMGKPFLMFGFGFLMHAPGTFVIRNNDECKTAFEYIGEHGAKHSLRDMKIFMKAFGETAIKCSDVVYDAKNREFITPDPKENEDNYFLGYRQTIDSLLRENYGESER